jgi:hypothetical protein
MCMGGINGQGKTDDGAHAILTIFEAVNVPISRVAASRCSPV